MGWLKSSPLIFILISLTPTYDEKEILDYSKEVFPDSTSFAVVDVFVSDYESFKDYMKPAKPTVDEDRFFGVLVWKNSDLLGYCFVVNEIGKEQPITFLVCIDAENSVRFVEVLRYRETRGGEIRSKLFLKQFIGKKQEDKLLVGKDIKNIRGATLSAWATTRAVRKAFAIIKAIQNGYADYSVRKILKVPKTEKISRCYQIGDSFLCLRCACDKHILDEVQKLSQKISKEFSEFYQNGTISEDIAYLIQKYGKVKDKVRYFDIYWNGKADLGGVWKGYVVDKVSLFLQKHNVKDFEVNFGWSSFFFSEPKVIDIFGRRIVYKGALSVSDSESDYSRIFDPVSRRYVGSKGKVAVLHKSAEFSDFASTLCIIWEKCEDFIKSKGGIIIREK